MLKRYAEAVCWMARHEGAVLVVTATSARLVDELHHHNEGLSRQASAALAGDPHRARWFTVEEDGARKRLRLNADGVMFHSQLVGQKKCSCPSKPKGETA